MTAIIRPVNYDLAELERGLERSIYQWAQSGFAWLGVSVVVCVLIFLAQPSWLVSTEARLINWLMDRQHASIGIDTEPAAVERTGTLTPQDLPKDQAAMTQWLSRKYRVAPEPLSALVAEAFVIGEKTKIAPSLILAVMAIESRFNPYAQSHVGAQGLMQVMTRVHSDKYEAFGGKLAAFDPLTNLRVGAKILQDCIKNAGGSVEQGLKLYVGAALLVEDGGYADKVLAEEERLRSVASGRQVSILPISNPAKSTDAQNERLKAHQSTVINVQTVL
jgi:Transglycosylase SLT domain